MSHPRDPEPGTGGTPGSPPEHPHGLVEELKEELHEVVEHVPQPVRWTVSRIAGLVVLGFAGLVIVVLVSAGLYVARRTEWVARELALVLNQALATRSDLGIELGDLRGNPLTGMRVLRPVVRFRDGDHPPVLEARELKLRYSAWALATGGSGPIEVTVIEPVIRLPRRADGSMRVPAWRGKGKAGSKARALRFAVTLQKGHVSLPVLPGSIEGLDLRARVDLGLGTRVALERLSWTSGPWDTPLQQLRAELAAGDSVKIRVLELRTPELVARGDVAWQSGTTRRRVRARIDRVRWAWLARVFDNGVFDVPGEGAADLEAVGDTQWRGDFRARFDWNGLTGDGRGGFAWAGRELKVAPLAATTSGGDLDGSFVWAGKRWALDATAAHADPRAWKSFHLDGWPQGDLNGAFQLSQNERKDLRLAARLGSSMLAGWRGDSASVTFDGPSATTDTFTVRYVRRDGVVHLNAGTRPWGWLGQWRAERFPLEEWPDGRASGIRGTLLVGGGNVTNRDGELLVDGTLEGEQSDWLGGHFARWRLDGVRGRLLPVPDLAAVARLEDLMFLGLHWDSTRVDLRLQDRTAELPAIVAHAGDTLVSVSGASRWSESGWNLRLDRAEMSSQQLHWVAEPPVLFAGDPQGVDFERLLAHDGAARLECRGRWAAPGGHYQFDAVARGLDVGRLGMPLDWQLGGRADASLSVRGPNGDPIWEFEGDCRGPEQLGHRADSLRVVLAGRQHRLEVRAFSVGVAGGHIDGSGSVEGTARAWPDTLTAEGVVRWLADAGRWDAVARLDRVALEGADHLMPEPIGWTGRFDGEVRLGGRPGDPTATASGEVRPFGWREFTVDGLALRARYGDRRLAVEELRMTRGTVTSRIAGSMPLRLALGERATVPDAAMDWTAEIPNGDLALLPAFVPQIGWARGRFDMNATVGGTARKPKLAGTLAVRDGALRMAGREEVLDRLSAAFRFDEARITLDSLLARQGNAGTVRGKGVIELEGLGLERYRFDLGLRQFTATEAGLYAAEFDGDFVVTNGPRVHGATLPQVTGQVDLRRAAVLFDFANQSETQQLAATTQPLFWTYRVELDATRNLHWQPPDGDIEFSADLTLEQTPDSLQIYGDLTALRGTYYFLSNRFDIKTANLTFDNENGVNPVLDIEATTRLVPTQEPISELEASSGNATKTHTVTARITGRAAEPSVEFVSDPPDWDEPRILGELTVGRFYDAQKGGVRAVSIGDPLDNYLTRAINRTVSAEVSRAFRGYINEWALERERGGLLQGRGDLVLGVGSQLTPNLSVRYRQRLPGLGRAETLPGEIDNAFERDVEAEYRLNRFFYVTTELKQRRTLTGGTAGEAAGADFNVNLKARWEY